MTGPDGPRSLLGGLHGPAPSPQLVRDYDAAIDQANRVIGRVTARINELRQSGNADEIGEWRALRRRVAQTRDALRVNNAQQVAQFNAECGALLDRIDPPGP